MCAGIDLGKTTYKHFLREKRERETEKLDLESHDVRDDHHRLRPPVDEVSQEQEVPCETPRDRVSPSAKRWGLVCLWHHRVPHSGDTARVKSLWGYNPV